MLDLPLIFVAVALHRRVIIHHHVRSYVEQRHFGRSFLFWLADRSCVTHIVLCNSMLHRFVGVYSLTRASIVVVDNSLWVDPLLREIPPTNPQSSGDRAVRLGFISNLIAEKGVERFVDVVEALRRFGRETDGIVAGSPIVPGASGLRERLRDTPWIDYRGHVSGDDKTQLFREFDWLVFLTRYLHECAPLVVHEALAAGVGVVTTDVGCNRDTIFPPSILVPPHFDVHHPSFPNVAAALVPLRPADRQAISAEHRRRHNMGDSALRSCFGLKNTLDGVQSRPGA